VPAADVPRIQPIHLQAAGRSMLPAEEVRVGHAPGIPIAGVAHAVGATPRIGQSQATLGQRHGGTKGQKHQCTQHRHIWIAKDIDKYRTIYYLFIHFHIQ